MKQILLISIFAAFANNLVFGQLLGLVPFYKASVKCRNAVKMGLCVTFFLTVSSLLNSLVYRYVLMPLKLPYLQMITAVLLIIALVKMTGWLTGKFWKKMYEKIEDCLNGMMVNSALTGVILLNVQKDYGTGYSTIYGFAAGIGFLAALVIMAGVNEKTEKNDIPESFKGLPLWFLKAGLIGMVFSGFAAFL